MFLCRLSMQMWEHILCPPSVLKSTRLLLWLPPPRSVGDRSWQSRGAMSQNSQNLNIFPSLLRTQTKQSHYTLFITCVNVNGLVRADFTNISNIYLDCYNHTCFSALLWISPYLMCWLFLFLSFWYLIMPCMPLIIIIYLLISTLFSVNCRCSVSMCTYDLLPTMAGAIYNWFLIGIRVGQFHCTLNSPWLFFLRVCVEPVPWNMCNATVRSSILRPSTNICSRDIC